MALRRHHGQEQERRFLEIETQRQQQALFRRNDLDAAGGMEYIAEVVDSVASAANLEHHARIVKDKSILPRLIAASPATLKPGCASIRRRKPARTIA